MKEKTVHHAVSKYLDAKDYILSCGYSDEIEWQDSLDIRWIKESVFLQEAAWVIISSGMRETVVRKVFPKVSKAFYDWESSNKILKNYEVCLTSSLEVFGNIRKMRAIIKIAEIINSMGFEKIIQTISKDGLKFIQTLPFMGPATSCHFGKNIGLDVAKPDRHLIRIASILGYSCPHALCYEIAKSTDEKTSVVDLVLWRYAVTNNSYLDFFKD
jgi:hypothetical protein